MSITDAKLDRDVTNWPALVISQSDHLRDVIVGQFDVQPPANVYRRGNRFEMTGFHARSNTAEMVEFHPFGNGTDLSLVHDPVNFQHLPVDLDGAVSLHRVDGPLPYPTGSTVPPVLYDITVKATTGLAVVSDVGERLSFDVSLLGSGSIGDAGLLTTSALTESDGNVTVRAHCQVLSDGAALPVVPATREFLVG